jgi:hypothetical protein
MELHAEREQLEVELAALRGRVAVAEQERDLGRQERARFLADNLGLRRALADDLATLPAPAPARGPLGADSTNWSTGGATAGAPKGYAQRGPSTGLDRSESPLALERGLGAPCGRASPPSCDMPPWSAELSLPKPLLPPLPPPPPSPLAPGGTGTGNDSTRAKRCTFPRGDVPDSQDSFLGNLAIGSQSSSPGGHGCQISYAEIRREGTP